MTHEKIIERTSGDQIKIIVKLYIESYDQKTYWTAYLAYKKKRARNWTFVHQRDDFAYRRASPDERRALDHQQLLEYVTEAEIMDAKKEYWQLLNPENQIKQ